MPRNKLPSSSSQYHLKETLKQLGFWFGEPQKQKQLKLNFWYLMILSCCWSLSRSACFGECCSITVAMGKFFYSKRMMRVILPFTCKPFKMLWNFQRSIIFYFRHRWISLLPLSINKLVKTELSLWISLLDTESLKRSLLEPFEGTRKHKIGMGFHMLFRSSTIFFYSSKSDWRGIRRLAKFHANPLLFTLLYNIYSCHLVFI